MYNLKFFRLIFSVVGCRSGSAIRIVIVNRMDCDPEKNLDREPSLDRDPNFFLDRDPNSDHDPGCGQIEHIYIKLHCSFVV